MLPEGRPDLHGAVTCARTRRKSSAIRNCGPMPTPSARGVTRRLARTPTAHTHHAESEHGKLLRGVPHAAHGAEHQGRDPRSFDVGSGAGEHHPARHSERVQLLPQGPGCAMVIEEDEGLVRRGVAPEVDPAGRRVRGCRQGRCRSGPEVDRNSEYAGRGSAGARECAVAPGEISGRCASVSGDAAGAGGRTAAGARGGGAAPGCPSGGQGGGGPVAGGARWRTRSRRSG